MKSAGRPVVTGAPPHLTSCTGGLKHVQTKSATEVDKQVGARIRARRQALQISQTALGEAAGITFQQVQKYENGGNRISTGRLAQIAETLEVPVAYFFDGLDSTAAASDLLADPQI